MAKTSSRIDRKLRLSPIADFAPHMRAGELVAFNVGPDDLVYVVLAKNPLDYRRTAPNGCTFAKTVANMPQSYEVVVVCDGQVVSKVEIAEEPFNIHCVQPLLPDELLLVCGRSYWRGPEDFDKNGRIYGRDGAFVREILLGDGISDVQTTSEGVIWTSYFDEGVFGNYGWSQPIGEAGLIAWDRRGNKLYEYQPAGGLDTICDCYALNVASNSDVWCYYYTEFPLVHIANWRVNSHWSMPISGCDAFAIKGNHALFRGGYKSRDAFHLVAISNDQTADVVARVQLKNERDEPLMGTRAVARGDSFHVLDNSLLYRVDVETVVRSVQ